MNVRLISRMGLLIAVGVVASYTSAIPMLGARLFPVQHALNVIAGAFLGPVYAGIVALAIALTRIMLGTGTPLAIPGSVCGAVLAGLLYQRFRSRTAAVVGEVIGTGLLGALLAYPIAVLFLNNAKAAAAGVTFFIIPFALSSISGGILGGMALLVLERFVPAMQSRGTR